jgi:hypothetical protein
MPSYTRDDKKSHAYLTELLLHVYVKLLRVVPVSFTMFITSYL